MRASRVLPLAAVAAILASFGAVNAAAAAVQSQVRVVYVSPDSAGADVYVDSVRTLSNVGYKTVSSYMAVGAGSHTVDVRPAGASATSTPWAHVTQVFAANGDYTVAVGGRFGQLQSAVFQDQFPVPGSGQAVARFIHMAPDVPAVDVVVKGGPVLFSHISFLQASPYMALTAGTYNLQLLASGTSQVLFTASSVVAAKGSVHSETGIGGVGSPVELLQIADAASATSAPVGGANTGGGGMAGHQPQPASLAALGVLAGSALLLAAPAIRRWRGRARG